MQQRHGKNIQNWTCRCLSPAVCLKYTTFHGLSKSILFLDVRSMCASHVGEGSEN